MNGRYKISSTALFPIAKLRLFSALRERFKEPYGFEDFRADMMAGLVVGMVAIPLAMALAIASGAAPQSGLYTVIIGGAVVALLGGSQFQVTGPTAAFVVILFPVVQKFGFAGLLIAGLMAGFILLFMGLARMGRLIQFIPHPVTTGFTAGIALVIATLQLKDFFGLQTTEELPERFLEKVFILFQARGTWSWIELTIGAATLIILALWPKLNKKIPAPLVALSAISVGVVVLSKFFPDFNVATIGSRFSFKINGVIGQGIPQAMPSISWPWNFVSQDGRPFLFSFETLLSIAPSAFAIAMLGAIESLLSAVIADGMTQTKHDPDAELVALGIGNILCPFFGGIPATGAIARTATNIRFGARSPVSAIIHAIFTIFVILLLAPFVSYLPMAALAALLIFVAYNMSELRHFVHILKVAPRSDVTVLLLCFFLTVIFDMVVGVTVGVMLAALLFMRRMAELTTGSKVYREHPIFKANRQIAPTDVLVYKIDGPLFFGAAQKTAQTLVDITDNVHGVVFLMDDVPTMDVTGLVALESAIRRLLNSGKKVCLSGLRPQPKELINRSGIARYQKNILIADNIDQALGAMKGSREGVGSEASLSAP